MNTPRSNKSLVKSVIAAGVVVGLSSALHAAEPAYFDVAPGSHPHDVAAAPAPGGPVYYTAQRSGKLGILDPKSGKYEEIPLGRNSAPHGVIVGPDGAPWITDGGQNAIVRVDPVTRAVRVWPLPADVDYANLNTLTFDAKGRVWFTGQSGYYGRLVPATGDVKVWKAPRGNGPYASIAPAYVPPMPNPELQRGDPHVRRGCRGVSGASWGGGVAARTCFWG